MPDVTAMILNSRFLRTEISSLYVVCIVWKSAGYFMYGENNEARTSCGSCGFSQLTTPTDLFP